MSRFGVPNPAAAQRVFTDAPLRELQPFGIIAQFGGKPRGPQRNAARHGLLHVRVSGKLLLTLPQCQRIEGIGHGRRPLAQGFRGVAHVQPQGGQHLIVARAARMQASARRTDARREQILDRGLTIFIFQADVPLPRRVLIADRSQRLANQGEILGR